MSTAKPGMKEISETASGMLADMLNKPVESTTGIRKQGDEWKAVIEVLERRSIPDTQDILGVYEVSMTHNMDVLGYKRLGLRRRGDMNVVEEMDE